MNKDLAVTKVTAARKQKLKPSAELVDLLISTLYYGGAPLPPASTTVAPPPPPPPLTNFEAMQQYTRHPFPGKFSHGAASTTGTVATSLEDEDAELAMALSLSMEGIDTGGGPPAGTDGAGTGAAGVAAAGTATGGRLSRSGSAASFLAPAFNSVSSTVSEGLSSVVSSFSSLIANAGKVCACMSACRHP